VGKGGKFQGWVMEVEKLALRNLLIEGLTVIMVGIGREGLVLVKDNFFFWTTSRIGSAHKRPIKFGIKCEKF